MAGYRATLTGIKAGGIILVVVIIGFIIFLAGTQVLSYILSLTPTLTPTLTRTPLPTATGTRLPPTATPTPPPSPTPTPLGGVVALTIWARSGCYEAFAAIQRIPEGGNVRFLPSERRFDIFNRECVLVEFDNGSQSVIGWMLIADLVQ